jgi:NAD(P)-dependent dehydrogenase (short-subunit alcohol dehydrogenase family)
VNCVFQADLLQGKVILVTGGGTGLGRAMGERFLQLGAGLAICGRQLEVAEQAAADMARTTGGECTLALGKRWLEQGQPGTMLNIVTTYA